MDLLVQSLTQHSGLVLAVLILAVVALSIVVIVNVRKQIATAKRWRDLLRADSGTNLELILEDHLRQRTALERQVELLGNRISELEKKMLTSKRFVGLVRFDAFDDVGGNQSFALAVYDDNGNGVIISSLIGRADCRVYCKPLVGGRSDREFSQEEQRAMREAANSSPKALVGP